MRSIKLWILVAILLGVLVGLGLRKLVPDSAEATPTTSALITQSGDYTVVGQEQGATPQKVEFKAITSFTSGEAGVAITVLNGQGGIACNATNIGNATTEALGQVLLDYAQAHAPNTLDDSGSGDLE